MTKNNGRGWLEDHQKSHRMHVWYFFDIYLHLNSSPDSGSYRVLTSNRGDGDEPLWRIGLGTRVPLQGAVDVVPLLGAIVGCHCRVLWLGGEGDDRLELWGNGRGAIAGCHCRVLWLGGGDDQL